MSEAVAKKVDDFFSNYPLKQFKKGQVLVYAGDQPLGVFYLMKGEVRQYVITNPGDEVVVNIYKSGTFFPMTWAINNTPNEYFFEASTDIKLKIAPVNGTVEFLKANSDVTFDLLSRLLKGMSGVLQRMTQLMKGTARTRTVLELIITCKRFGLQHNEEYTVEVSEVELAARTGLTRETVSRELHKLQEEGLIEVAYKNVKVKNLARLEKELNSEL